MLIAVHAFWLLHIYFVFGLVMLVIGIIILVAIEFVTICIHHQGSFLYSMIPKLSNHDQIKEKTSKKKCWMVATGSCLIISATLIGIGEGTFYATGLNDMIMFTTGWFIGLSPLFCLTGLFCLVAFRHPGRKMLLLLITFGIFSLIGSCGLTYFALLLYGDGLLYLPQHFYIDYDFPSWPYYLVISMGTPVVTVVPLSTVVIILCLHLLLDPKHHRKNDKMLDEEETIDKGFELVGFLFPGFGFGFHFCYFVLSILANQSHKGPDPYDMKFLSLEVVFVYTFTGLLAIVNKSRKTPLFQRSLLLLLSACDFYLSVKMLTNQYEMFEEQRKSSVFHLNCIPEAMRCNGKIDLLPSEARIAIDDCGFESENYQDETNCDTTRFVGFYVFNFVAGSIGFIMAGYLCIKLIWQAIESGLKKLS